MNKLSRPTKFDGKAVELNAIADVWDLLDDNPDIQWYSKNADIVCVKESNWNKLYNATKDKKYQISRLVTQKYF